MGLTSFTGRGECLPADLVLGISEDIGVLSDFGSDLTRADLTRAGLPDARLAIVSAAPFFADAIVRMHNGEPFYELLPYD